METYLIPADPEVAELTQKAIESYRLWKMADQQLDDELAVTPQALTAEDATKAGEVALHRALEKFSEGMSEEAAEDVERAFRLLKPKAAEAITINASTPQELRKALARVRLQELLPGRK